jgi:hypothetical protein
MNVQASNLVVRSEIYTAVTILMLLFWVIWPCELVGRSQRLREACCLDLQCSLNLAIQTELRCLRRSTQSVN